jgi:hypothetical protein
MNSMYGNLIPYYKVLKKNKLVRVSNVSSQRTESRCENVQGA